MAEPTESNAEQAMNGDGVRYRPRGRVIPADEIRAWETGKAFMTAATSEAERLKAEAVAAFDEAKKSGFEEGRTAGAESAARLLAETALRADRHLADADRQIVDLAMAVVRQVMGEFDVRQLTRNAVRHALSKQRQSQHLTLHVAPDMVEILRTDIDAQFAPEVRHLITVEPDPRLDPGQCRLASEIGFVDLGVDAQLKAIHQGLVEGLQRQISA
ncbi:MAG: type III secretion system stator protein SctL [Pseudomonadota bacterium]